MWRRLVALWLLLPPSGQVAAWVDVCREATHCGHDFCTCREHCERKPVSIPRCHGESEDPAPRPDRAMSDACHAGEARELLALQSYLLPKPDPTSRPFDTAPISFEETRDPRFGFSRIDLPPPRFVLS